MEELIKLQQKEKHLQMGLAYFPWTGFSQNSHLASTQPILSKDTPTATEFMPAPLQHTKQLFLHSNSAKMFHQGLDTCFTAPTHSVCLIPQKSKLPKTRGTSTHTGQISLHRDILPHSQAQSRSAAP